MSTVTYKEKFLEALERLREEEEGREREWYRKYEEAKTILSPVRKALNALVDMGVTKNGKSLYVREGMADEGYHISTGWEGESGIRASKVWLEYNNSKPAVYWSRPYVGESIHGVKDLDWIINTIYEDIAKVADPVDL